MPIRYKKPGQMSLDSAMQDRLEENCLEQPEALAEHAPVSLELLARDVPEVHKFP